ncbi:MAG: hypothetical protein UX17_C0003G0002 [Parcubacteria group bacterium GW2011_GWC2_45_7]|nr:MAG: hypothetical protein UX17_C0003G0002 [Parcubacteria group bacterium GW2011_GWC2_45_7]
MKKTKHVFENQAVLNPACIDVGDITHMFYRAVRYGNFSTIGYCQLRGKKVIKRLSQPFLTPQYDYERQGLEDPRIIKLENTYYLLYTAFDGKNARIAYAASDDLVHFEKQGVISPNITYDRAEDYFHNLKLQERYCLFESFYKNIVGLDVLLWEKDAFIFPKKINNKFALVHRILPGIQISYFDKFSDLTDKYWINYCKNLDKFIIMDPQFWFESRNIGGGCPPIETEKGWLIIYHTVQDAGIGKIYHAAAALLDLNNPQKVIGRLKEPLFSPQEKWEKSGDTPNVVFPTSAIVRGKKLFIYYGAADSCIGVKSVDLKTLLAALENSI